MVVSAVRRWFALLLGLCFLVSGLTGTVSAATQDLPVLSYKFYPLRDTVFVNFHNPYFTSADNIMVNMIIREGTGRNRVVAIGQTRMPANLVLAPGEHTSARVMIRTRVIRDIPALAEFEFKISGRPVPAEKTPPDVVVQDSSNGISLEVNRDNNKVPFVMGFIELNQNITEETKVNVQQAILTFYDQNHKIVWSEVMPINGTLTNSDSIMLWGKYDHITGSLVPDISSVEAKFVVVPAATTTNTRTR